MCATLTPSRRTDEDVHHQCQTPRCVDPDHLVVCSTAEHQAHHAAQRRREVCAQHNTPYDRRDPKTGKGICLHCGREACARYRRRTPRKPLTEAQRLRRNQLDRIRRNTPDGKAKRRAQDRAQRARRKALKAQCAQVAY